MTDVRDGRLVPAVRRVDGVLEATVTVTLIMHHLEGVVRLTSREQSAKRTVRLLRRATAGDVHGGEKQEALHCCSLTPITGGNPIWGFAVLPWALTRLNTH